MQIFLIFHSSIHRLIIFCKATKLSTQSKYKKGTKENGKHLNSLYDKSIGKVFSLSLYVPQGISTQFQNQNEYVHWNSENF